MRLVSKETFRLVEDDAKTFYSTSPPLGASRIKRSAIPAVSRTGVAAPFISQLTERRTYKYVLPEPNDVRPK